MQCFDAAIPAIKPANKSPLPPLANQKKKAIEKRDIKTGSDDGTYIEVFSELEEGEIVVEDEYSDINDELKIEVLPES